ncbi:hypothetical protein EH223_02855 [candidate division KSB1 bacterium]|nr:hypothetical protein [candidate division KSB1 bacterium]RQW06080.1 MAG: hypothetical protein EH223_02855 [candidate division KSB1 bacterium]
MTTLEGSKKIVQLLLAGLALLLCGQSYAAVVNNARGLPHTKAAYTTRAGHLTTAANLRFWGKKSPYADDNPDNKTNIWVVRALANLNYGFNTHGDVSLTPILYQDAHKLKDDYSEDPQILWDSFLNIKFGNYKVEKQPIWLGFDLGMRFPTGKKHNVIFEDYTAGKFEFGLTGLLTYRYANPNLENDFRIHANLGYWNYNDRGTQLTEVEPPELGKVDAMSQSIHYATGIQFPTRNFEYGLEFYGLAWLVRPPVGAASRENYFYMNVSFVYKPDHRFYLFSNADLRLSPANNSTERFTPHLPGMPSFPGWRINLGLKFQILPTVYDMHKTSVERQQEVKTKSLYVQLKREMQKTEKSKAELERLRKEKAERENVTPPSQ